MTKSHSRSIVKNIASLGIVQVSNYLIPLIIIPVLLNAIGVENYGVISLALGIISIFTTLTDYGLNLNSTRRISLSPSDKNLQSKVFFQVTVIKLSFCAIYFILLCFLVFLIPSWREQSNIILPSYLLVIGHSIFPLWYFQGTQKMSVIASIHVITKAIYIALIILYIKSPTDYIYVNPFNGLMLIIAGIAGMSIVFGKLGFRLITSNLDELIEEVKENTPIFISLFINALYSNSPIIIAGFFFSSIDLGLYGIIDKILWIIVGAFMVIFNSVYPIFCNISKQTPEKSLHFLLSILSKLIIIIIPSSIVIYFFGANLISLLSSEIDAQTVQPFFRQVAFIPILSFINLPITIILLGLNKRRKYFYFSLIQLITILIFGVTFSFFYFISGLLYAIILSEIIRLFYGAYQVYELIVKREVGFGTGISK